MCKLNTCLIANPPPYETPLCELPNALTDTILSQYITLCCIIRVIYSRYFA